MAARTEGHDGLPSPCVPDRCRLVIDRRFLIEERLEDVKAEVHGLLRRLAARAGRASATGARRDGGASGPGRARRCRCRRRWPARSRSVLGREAAVHLLARHLRPEAHRPDRPPARLRRLRPGHPRSRAPARRVRGDRRSRGLGQGDGARRPCSSWGSARDPAGAAQQPDATWPASWSATPRIIGARTGVTVVLAEPAALAAADVRGGAPGTINTDALRAGGLTQRVDGVVLSGGSVFGLEAATGLIGWLAAQGRGFAEWGPCLPIVTGAILFDLLNGGDKDWGAAPPYRGPGPCRRRCRQPGGGARQCRRRAGCRRRPGQGRARHRLGARRSYRHHRGGAGGSQSGGLGDHARQRHHVGLASRAGGRARRPAPRRRAPPATPSRPSAASA